MLKRLLLAIIALHGFLTHGQCDVAITAVNLETYEVTIEVLNSLGCTANGPGGVNGKVTQLQIGYHLPEPINPDNEVIEDFNETFGLPPCSPNWPGYLGQNPSSNHIGWWYSPSASVTFQEDIMGDGLVTGDVVTIPLNPPGDYDTYPYPLAECGDDLIDYWLSEDECIEFVVWQVNYGATWYQCNGGWADGTWCPDTYQDMDCDNSWYMCRDENPGAAVASPDFACPPDAPDAVVDNIEFEIGCIGDAPAYQLTYTVFNYGNDTITDYCIEIWNEDYYQCFDGDLFGSYEIPPGEGQQFTTPFFEYSGVGSFFTISVDSVNDEIVTGNNNTTVYYPDELEDLICPEECEPDTVEVVTYILQIDSIFTTLYDTVYDTVYVELPPDTIFETIYELDSIFIELPQDTVFLTEYENIYIYDTTYIEVTDTILVDNYIYEYITDTILVDNYIYETDTLFLTEYVTDTVFITTVDTIIKYEYILITDTVTEYIVQEIYIDCDTGLPCDEAPGFDCPDWTSIYIPNTFTPNNDGFNDVWKIILDLNCWYDVEFQIYNRWGDKIYHGYGDSFDSYPYWDGSIDDGDHYAADGVYTYIVKANKLGSAEVFRKSGYITIFR
jgi:gliding motility-associated-like protein